MRSIFFIGLLLSCTFISSCQFTPQKDIQPIQKKASIITSEDTELETEKESEHKNSKEN